MSKMKSCAECVGFDRVRLPVKEDEDYVALIEHYLDDHPQSGRFLSVVEEYVIPSECSNCGEEFKADVGVGDSGLTRELYCEECINENRLRKLQVTDVDTRDFVKRAKQKESE